MQTRALKRTLVVCLLLSCTPVGGSWAQDEPAASRVDRRAVISSEQLRRASQAVHQPALTATQPAPAATQPAPTAPQETLNLSALKAALSSDVRLTRFDPATKATEDVSDSANLQLEVGEYVAVASDQIQLAPLSDAQGRTYSAFPTMLITRNTDGSTRNLRLDNYSDGFVWDRDNASFEANIALAVSDMDNPRSADPLESPISIKISGQDLIGAPQKVEIRRLGFAGEEDVIVHSEGRADPVAVTMRHEIDPLAPQIVDLQLRKPTLTISANPPAIAGFGIESTEITVSAHGVLAADFPIVLDSDAGTFDPKEVRVGPAGSATSRLWSAGFGPVEVRVADSRFQVSAERVEFLKPVGFLLAVVLGAALGATFIYFWQRSRGSASIWAWSAAFVFGIGITVAAFAGFEIPQMLDLPAGRAGLVVPAATSFIAAILINAIYAALSGSGAKQD